MKLSGKIIHLLLLAVVMICFTKCKKEDPETIRKETFAGLLLKDINADSLKADVVWLQNMGTRFALAENHRNVALRIKKRFIQMGYANATIDSFLVQKTYRDVYYEQWQYNVMASIDGSKNPDSLCIIGAHYDDILSSGDPFTEGRGANDNASGVASVLEIARVMEKNNYKPEKTIMFVAFGSEELGLFGSKDLAADFYGLSSEISFMLNFDMVAFEPSANPASWIVDIMDYDNSHYLREEAQGMCTKYTQLQYKNDNTYNKQSDSYSFFIYGYKALFFFCGSSDPNYHSLNDLSENCNFSYCSQIVKASCALLVYKN